MNKDDKKKGKEKMNSFAMNPKYARIFVTEK